MIGQCLVKLGPCEEDLSDTGNAALFNEIKDHYAASYHGRTPTISQNCRKIVDTAFASEINPFGN